MVPMQNITPIINHYVQTRREVIAITFGIHMSATFVMHELAQLEVHVGRPLLNLSQQ